MPSQGLVLIVFLTFDSDFDSLSPHDIKSNCKTAFDAGDQLGIPRVIEPTDMHMLAGESNRFSCAYFLILGETL